jgi:hypothetical protein
MAERSRDYLAEDTGAFVVVTIAPNGIVHAWGAGPGVDDSDSVVPFRYRADARRAANWFRREDTEHRLTRNPDVDGEQEPLIVKVCKVLGTDPVEVKG